MDSAPEIRSEKVAAAKLEAERVAFLRKCGEAFAGSGNALGDLRLGPKPLVRSEAAEGLVYEWGLIFDTIEATRTVK